jgi:hypothetical protein
MPDILLENENFTVYWGQRSQRWQVTDLTSYLLIRYPKHLIQGTLPYVTVRVL